MSGTWTHQELLLQEIEVCKMCRKPSNSCPKKNKISEVRCYNCEGNHSVSYKGCEVRKLLQQKLFPKLREKRYEVHSDKNVQTPKSSNRTTISQPNTSYAQTIKEGNIISQPQHSEE